MRVTSLKQAAEQLPLMADVQKNHLDVSSTSTHPRATVEVLEPAQGLSTSLLEVKTLTLVVFIFSYYSSYYNGD